MAGSLASPASFVNAIYGYVYDFNGWLNAIRWQDGVLGNVDEFMTGNAMSPRDSALLSWADDWVELFNNQFVPVTENPEDHLYGIWEPYGDPYNQACCYIYDNGVETDRVGVRGVIRLRYRFHRSTLTQEISLFPGSRRLDFATEADWDNKLYKDVSAVPPEGFRPFYGSTFITLDQSVPNTGFINCIVLED